MNAGVWARRMASEIQLHKLCNGHKNIIHFYNTAENPQWRWVVLEFAQGGDLFDKIGGCMNLSFLLTDLQFRA